MHNICSVGSQKSIVDKKDNDRLTENSTHTAIGLPRWAHSPEEENHTRASSKQNGKPLSSRRVTFEDVENHNNTAVPKEALRPVRSLVNMNYVPL